MPEGPQMLLVGEQGAESHLVQSVLREPLGQRGGAGDGPGRDGRDEEELRRVEARRSERAVRELQQVEHHAHRRRHHQHVPSYGLPSAATPQPRSSASPCRTVASSADPNCRHPVSGVALWQPYPADGLRGRQRRRRAHGHQQRVAFLQIGKV